MYGLNNPENIFTSLKLKSEIIILTKWTTKDIRVISIHKYCDQRFAQYHTPILSHSHSHYSNFQIASQQRQLTQRILTTSNEQYR